MQKKIRLDVKVVGFLRFFFFRRQASGNARGLGLCRPAIMSRAQGGGIHNHRKVGQTRDIATVLPDPSHGELGQTYYSPELTGGFLGVGIFVEGKV